MSRFSAFAIHLGISLAIFFVLAYLVVFEWYPGLFFDTEGGWQGIRIIIGVDLVLGPTLTLIVFKAGKPGLKTDLALIGLLQLVCLFAGTYVVYDQRPQLVAFNDGRFTVMTDDDFSGATAMPDLASFPGDDPKWVLVEVPEDPIAEAEFRSATFKQGKLIATATENYVPFSTDHKQFISNALDPAIIFAKEGGPEAIDEWVAEHGGSAQDYRFYILSTRYTYGYLGFRASGGEPLGLLSVLAY